MDIQGEVFIFVHPPKTVLHDEMRVVQCQRMVKPDDGERGSIRIRPVLNLELHRLSATRVIELEQDDARLCEFLPAGCAPTKRRPRESISRDYSLKRKRNGACGGKIASQDRGLEMDVLSSEGSGIFEFRPSKGLPSDTLTWRRRIGVTGVPEWCLIDSTSIAIQESLRPTIAKRSESQATQYTDILDDESALSAQETTPNRSARPSGEQSSSEPHETVLSSLPVPHLHRPDSRHGNQSPRSSMAEVRDQRRRQYRLLLSALWILWSTDDVMHSGHTSPVKEDPAVTAPLGTYTAGPLNQERRSRKLCFCIPFNG